MMQVFLAGTDVTLTIPLQDRSGNQLVVSAISYRVVDQAGVELIAKTALAGFTASDASAVVAVGASLNNIAAIPTTLTQAQVGALQTREIRTIELYCTISGNIVILSGSYGLEPIDPLYVGINSFQSFAQSQLTALDIPNITSWDAADDHQKIAALVDARAHLLQLNYSLLQSNINYGQDSLNFVPEGQYQSNYAATNSLFMFNGNLSLLSPTQYASLPERFKATLRQAQLVEADAILGGNASDQKRQDGLVAEGIGETSQKWRSGKPLDLPVCKRALRYLGYYVTMVKRIGRG